MSRWVRGGRGQPRRGARSRRARDGAQHRDGAQGWSYETHCRAGLAVICQTAAKYAGFLTRADCQGLARGDSSAMALRIVVAAYAAARAVLIYGEAEGLATRRLEPPRLRRADRSPVRRGSASARPPVDARPAKLVV